MLYNAVYYNYTGLFAVLQMKALCTILSSCSLGCRPISGWNVLVFGFRQSTIRPYHA